MSQYFKVLRNSGIYSLVSILQKAIGFILLPLYTAYLSVYDYGVLSLVTAMTGLLSVFFLLSLHGALSRYYFEYKSDSLKLNQFISTIINFDLLVCSVLTVFLIVFKDYLIIPFAKGVDFYPYLFVGVIIVFLNPIYLLFQTMLQTQEKAKVYAKNQLFFFISNLILTILFVVVLKMKAFGVLTALLLTNMFFFIYSLIYFMPIMKYGISKSILKEVLQYAFPLIPHSLSAWSITMIDRFFINNLINTSNVGIYNIGFQLGSIINVISLAINSAFVPWFFDKMKNKEDNNSQIIKFAEFINLFVCIIALFISLFSQEILSIMVSKNYQQGWKVVPFICFAFAFNNLYFFFVNPLFYNKNGTKYIPIITIVSAVFGVAFNLILIPRFGFIGSAIANIVSWFLTSIIALIISHRIEKVDYNFIKMFGLVFLFFGLSLLTFVLANFDGILSFVLKLFLTLVVIFTVWLIKRKDYEAPIAVFYTKFKLKS